MYLRVLKNTLARRAVKDTPFEKLADQMVGPLVYGISSDPVATAKVLNEFAKGNDKFVIKAGAMPNAVISAKEVAALAIAAVAARSCSPCSWATMQAPIAKFVQHAQRGAVEVRPHPCRRARREGKGRGLIPSRYAGYRNLSDSGASEKWLSHKQKFSTQSQT